jgi:hypothetical protein
MKLSKAILTTDNVLVPAGTELTFKGNIAKYQHHEVRRDLVPLECIVGARGPFLHACAAQVLNDNRLLQQIKKTAYQPWCHCIAYGNNCFVYIWDTREVVDVITGLSQHVPGKVHTRTLVNKQTGQRVNQYLGRDKQGWAKSFYEMITWPQYHRPDNGLPLVTKNPEWAELVKALNESAIKAEAAYERYDETMRDEYARQGLAMPDGAYPITDKEDLENAIKAYGRAKDKVAVKAFIIRRAHELGAVDMLPESWLEEANEALTVVPAEGVANTHIVKLDDVEVARITAEQLEMCGYSFEEPEGEETEGEDKKPVELPAYKNTDKNKLIVVDTAGKPMELTCLTEDIVKCDTLLDEIAKSIGANENLTQDIFKNYESCTGKEFAHDFKVIYISDLYELCGVIERINKAKPSIALNDDNTAEICTQNAVISFDFNKMEYDIDGNGEVVMPVDIFIRKHFNPGLKRHEGLQIS